MNIKKIFVIGTGTMGVGICQVALTKGYDVTVATSKPIEIATEKIDKALSKAVAKQKLSEDGKLESLKRFSATNNLEDAKDADLVIEAVSENMELKESYFKRLDEICKRETILASNTSSLSVTNIASKTKRMDKVIGIHFFNPVPAMKLVEIVKNMFCSQETIDIATEFVKSLDKEVIFSNDTPGFIVNYLQYPFRLHAIRMVERGIATPEEIDKAAKLGLGHPMGPLELQDLVGLDVTYNAVSAIYEETKDPMMAPPVLMKRMVEAGLLGRKTGRGFYQYNK